MSDSSKFVAESLEELLTGIADGVREAQASLSEAPPFDAYGRPVPSYHLPYVDFDLKVDMETTETPSGARLLRVKPFTSTTQKSVNKEISSSISGRFVAIPPGEGLPVPMLLLSSTRLSARKHTIEVSAANSAGEVLQNVQIELNFNLNLSQQLSSTQGVNLTTLRSSHLAAALLVTDENGVASTELTVDSGIPAKASIVITAELEQRIANIVVAAGNES